MLMENQKLRDEGVPVFYEIFRRHTIVDRRSTYTDDYLIGTCDLDSDFTAIICTLQAGADAVMKKREGYRNVWVDFETPDASFEGGVRIGKQSTSEWVDKFGFQNALLKFRKIDPTFVAAGEPRYFVRAVKRAATFVLNDIIS
jgi:hypothetical protein